MSIWGFPKIRGTLFGGPYNKDYNIWGSILGYPYFGKLPYPLGGKCIEVLSYRKLQYLGQQAELLYESNFKEKLDVLNLYMVNLTPL